MRSNTLIDLLISYALYVVPSYAWNCGAFQYNKLVWRPMVSDSLCTEPGSAYKTTTNHETTRTPT